MQEPNSGRSGPEVAGVRYSISSSESTIEPACLTIEETAAYIRVSRHTAYAMARDGRLPVVHPVPRRTLVVKAKLDALLADGTLGAVIVKPAAGDSPAKS